MRSPDRFLRPARRVVVGDAGLRQVAIAFLLAGGLASIAGTLVPDPDTRDHGPLLILATACCGLAAVLAAWRRPPHWVLANLPTLGLLLVSFGVATATPLASTPTYYLLPILASAYFSSARRLALDLGVCAGSLALVLALWVEPEVRSAIFIGTVIPAFCVAIVVAGLKRRLDAQVDGLRNLADTDPLTGALNHGAFGVALDVVVERWHATGRGAALLLVDIDHFKQVNDSFGHQEGDRMLQLVCKVLNAQKRREDVLGRIGGEEFALLLPGAGRAAAGAVAERIREALRGATQDTPAALTLSVGIAELSPVVESPHALVRAADRALYTAKERGRDQAVMLAVDELAAA